MCGDTLIKPPTTVYEELLLEAYDECEWVASSVEELGLPKRLAEECRRAVTVSDILLAVEAVRGYVEELSIHCTTSCDRLTAVRAVVESVKQIVEALEVRARHTSRREVSRLQAQAF